MAAAGGGRNGTAVRLPAKEVLDSPSSDVREVFQELRAWVRAHQRLPGELEEHARALDPGHRRSVFAFLCAVPTRKPIFSAQAKEVLVLLSEREDWTSGGVVNERQLQAALGQPSSPSKAAAEKASGRDVGGAAFAPPEYRSPVGDALGPPPLPPPAEAPQPSPLPAAAKEEEPSDIMTGFPPPEAFKERSKHDPGDTFKALRKWARRLPVWDLATAGSRLEASVRKDVFVFVTRICERRLYSAQGRELLSMLLSVQEWGEGDGVVDEAAVDKVLDSQPSSSPSPSPPAPPTKPRTASAQPAGREPAPAPAPAAPPFTPAPRPTPTRDPAPPRPTPTREPAAPAPAPDRRPQREPLPVHEVVPGPQPEAPPRPPPGGPGPAPRPRRSSSQDRLQTPPGSAPGKTAPAPSAGLRARVEAALRSNAMAISGGQDLVRLYQDSGLGGEASLSAQARDRDSLRLLLAIAGQRLRDLYVDDLQNSSGKAKVHFPHLYIDIQRRAAFPMPDAVRASVEAKIRRFERWTCIEKAYVLGAKHEQTICYILAYSLSRARATGRPGAVWLALGMNTGAQGHANAVCLETGRGGAPKAWVYDPNYCPGQEHWVHAQKAVSDALPKVRRLLEGTGIPVAERAELFGHGLQTSLGTTSRSRGWFSSKVTTTTRGYPICGSVVHLLALTWLGVSNAGGGLESLVEVEAAMAEIVAESPEGKALVQCRIAGLLRGLAVRLSDRGEDPFAASLKRRLDMDKRDWPEEVVRAGGSISMSGTRGRSCTYTW